MIKRLFDILIASMALLVSWPLILIGVLAVKLTSPGPVFYHAKRAGLGGKPFVMFKLRTMYVSTDSLDRRVTADDDDRITPVGRALRRFRIDELPQFWNVLRGDMSIIGPRPEDWSIVERYYTPRQRRTLEVKPGIASLSDVYWYPDLTYHDPPPEGVSMQDHYLKRHLHIKLEQEIAYAERHTLLMDLQILLQTAYCVLFRSWLPPERKPLPDIEGESGQPGELGERLQLREDMPSQ
jgi:lipopolysaccharide/colanic/teichoic acid biosynthesis glycosyltransferase